MQRPTGRRRNGRRGGDVSNQAKRTINKRWHWKLLLGAVGALLTVFWLRLNRLVIGPILTNYDVGDQPRQPTMMSSTVINQEKPPTEERIWGNEEELQQEKISTRKLDDASQGNHSVTKVVTFYLEPPTTMDTTQTIPLPPRRTSAAKLEKKEFPAATCLPSSLINFPIDNYPLSDPFLPWIHDYFVMDDAVRIVAQNRRRCETGEGKEVVMKYWEPQVAMFQPVPVQRIQFGNSTRYRLSTLQDATNPETRFLCRFHSIDREEITLSVFPFNYDFIKWRKRIGENMFAQEGTDVEHYELSQLVFSCPIPDAFKSSTDEMWLDIIPIRTPARRDKWLFTEDHVGPDSSVAFFDPAVEYGGHVLPEIVDSGRIANLPLCKPEPKTPKHRFVVCTWTSASYNRRGDKTKIEDSAIRFREWILFHKMVGVDHIYVYDNTMPGDKSLHDVVKQFADYITYHPWPARVCSNNRPNHKNPGERSSQYAAESSCRERYGNSTEWMSFLDTDEYLVPMTNKTWQVILQEISVKRPSVHVLKMRSSRGRPRENLMEPLADQSQCKTESRRKSKIPLDECLVPRKNETFLRVYNCDYIKPPRPDRFQRAMKQIYRPSFVLSHFVHYTTVTTAMARYYRDRPRQFKRRVQASEYAEKFLDELTEATLIHAKTVLPYETMTRTAYCQSGKVHGGCGIGRMCPASTPFVDETHQENPFVDENGEFCNCWINSHVESYWVPRLEDALK